MENTDLKETAFDAAEKIIPSNEDCYKEKRAIFVLGSEWEKKNITAPQPEAATREGEENEIKTLVNALEVTLSALKDVVKQIPNDENLADYQLDFAEHAEALAMKTLSEFKPLPTPPNQ